MPRGAVDHHACPRHASPGIAPWSREQQDRLNEGELMPFSGISTLPPRFLPIRILLPIDEDLFHGAAIWRDHQGDPTVRSVRNSKLLVAAVLLAGCAAYPAPNEQLAASE